MLYIKRSLLYYFQIWFVVSDTIHDKSLSSFIRTSYELPCFLLFILEYKYAGLACCSNEKVLLNWANIKNSHANELNDYCYRRTW